MNFILFINTLLFLLIDPVKSAGVGVHLYIAYRSQVNLPAQLHNYQSQYYAGAFHPDAFYHCFDESLAAENSHWPPFLKLAVEYYHKEYISKGLSNDPLKAFIYGIFTHQVADVSWHSLYSDQGLLDMLAHLEFNGQITKAHNYLDTVGDFIILNRQFENLSKEKRRLLVSSLQVQWKYPIKDILRIYHELGFTEINEIKLNICMNRGYSALQGEITAVLTERATDNRINIDFKESPLTVAILNDYYYGGIDQIIHTLNPCIKELDKWFLNDPYLNPWDICKPLFKEHSIDFKSSMLLEESKYSKNKIVESTHLNIAHWANENKLYLSSNIPNSKFGTNFRIGNFLNNEPTIAISAPFEENAGSVYFVPLSEVIRDTLYAFPSVNKKLTCSRLSNDQDIELSFPPRFGAKIFKWDLNNKEFLIISEPGTSKFKVFHDGTIIANLESRNTDKMLGGSGLKQWTILNIADYDINSDGWDDLIIGSMFSDNESNKNSSQNGIVLVIDGKKFYQKIIKLLDSSLTNMLLYTPSIDIKSVILHVFETPDYLAPVDGYDQFGSTFATTKNMILIGVNSIGGIAIFNKTSNEYLGLLTAFKHLSVGPKETSDKISRKSSKETSLYAYNSILTGSIDGTEWILVSSAGESYDNNCPLCGIVYLYSLSEGSFHLVTKLIPTRDALKPIIGTNRFINSMFGGNMLKLSESAVVITSNGYDDGRGALFLVNLKRIFFEDKPDEFYESQLFFVGDTDTGFTNFGNDCIQSFNYNDRIYLAISLTNYIFVEPTANQNIQSGALLVLDIGNPLLK